MQLALSRADQVFADEARNWLNEHLVGEFARHRGAGGVADDEYWDVRLAWERELASGGWLGISWPAAYGGRGGTPRQEAIFALESARVNPPFRASVQGLELVGPMLLAFGSEEQKRRFLPPILAVEEFWAQGFSEPGAGSDIANVQTRANLVGDEWVLDGQKVWTTTGTRAQWLYVLARSEPNSVRHHGLSMFLVPVDQPGVDIRPIRNLCGRGEFCETFLDSAKTSTELVVGAPGEGWRVTMGALGNERGLGLIAQHMGFLDEVEALARLLDVDARPAAPALRARLVEAWVSAKVVHWNAERLVDSVFRGADAGMFPSASKVFASSFHQRLGSLSLDILDARGQVVGEGYELSDIQGTSLACLAESVYGGTTQIQLNLLGERALGLPRG
jgi:alkylation response protein AidB-like acyl-CoA dehydrogenase